MPLDLPPTLRRRRLYRQQPDRPALQRLLTDIQAGRLTASWTHGRSAQSLMLDFARLMRRLTSTTCLRERDSAFNAARRWAGWC